MRNIVYLLAAFFLSACAQSEDPKAWKEFVKAEGHLNEIPSNWLSTSEGKFAHAIKIPNPVPVDSGYKKSMSAREYFDHLCKTESGNYIFKTVESVEGLAILRAPIGLTEEQQNERWGSEAPGLQGRHVHQYEPAMVAAGFVNPPWQTYEYVELQEKDKKGFIRYAQYVEYAKYAKVNRLEAPSSRYVVTWRGIHREKDRENLISGYEWIVLDKEMGQVLAVLRNYSQTGNTTNRKQGIYWQNSMQCPILTAIRGTNLISREDTRWLPRVLQPAIKPRVLINIDNVLDAKK